MQPAKLRGFTLVELSIVLVILGLLVGGVLAGQSLIRAAELRAVSKEYDGFVTAMNVFKDKYFALPGDMNNAVRYWDTAKSGGSLADGSDPTCVALATPSTDAKTCNGDGNGRIEFSLRETTRAWQHLANAGLVAGSFTGIWGTGYLGGSNVPKSRLSNGRWIISYFAPDPLYNYMLDYKNSLSFSDNANAPIFKAEDAYSIDMKIDDGKPQSGIVSSAGNATVWPNCVTATNDAYLLTDRTLGCSLLMMTRY